MKFFRIELCDILHSRLDAWLPVCFEKARHDIGLNDGYVDGLERQQVIDVLYGAFSNDWNDPQLRSAIEHTRKIARNSDTGAIDIARNHADSADRRRFGWRRHRSRFSRGLRP